MCTLIALPALVSVYGITDDYSLLYNARTTGFNLLENVFVFLGRPLTSLLLAPALQWAGSVANLEWLRLAALGGILVYAILQDFSLRRFGWPLIPRIVTGLLSVTSPAAVVWMGWSVCFPYAWGAVMALLAGLVATRHDKNKACRWPMLSASILLLLASLATYQPSAATFLIPLMAVVFMEPGERLFRRLVVPGLAFLLTHLVYLVVFMAFHEPPSHPNVFSEKFAIGASSFEASVEFLARVLPSSIGSWGSLDSIAAGTFMGGLVVIVAGVAFIPIGSSDGTHPEAGKSALLRLIVFLACLTMSEAVVMATEGNFYFRTRFALYALIGLAVGEGLRKSLMMRTRWRRIPILAGFCLALFTVMGSGFGLWFRLVEPNAREFEQIRTAVNRQFEKPPRIMMLVLGNSPSLRIPSLMSQRSFEFGSTSRDVSWGMEPMVRGILLDSGHTLEASRRTVVLALPAAVDSLATTYPQVALPGTQTESFSTAWELIMTQQHSDTPLGPMLRLPASRENWVLSAHYGFMNTYYWQPESTSHIYHIDLGWLLVPPQTGGDSGISVYHSEIGWIWTSPLHYPNLYLNDRDVWAYIQPNPYGSTNLYLSDSGYLPIADHSFESDP